MLLSSAYLAPIHYYTKLLQNNGKVTYIEQYDHYMKQTFRNRCIIGSSEGPLTLTIPTIKTDEEKCFMKDIRISDHGNWRHQHWNALEAAYHQTPFFLYYEDDFRPFYEKHFEFLYDFNLQLTELICSLIDIHPLLYRTTEYLKESPDDFRAIIHPKHDYQNDISYNPAHYYQVFENKLGFIPNLSIVDLLFNMGPESLIVLQNSIQQK